jgi:hypothetical protein
MANNTLTTVLAAAAALRLPRIDREQDHFNLFVATPHMAWAALASVRTEAELRDAYARLRHLIPQNAEVMASRYHSYCHQDFSWRTEKVAL